MSKLLTLSSSQLLVVFNIGVLFGVISLVNIFIFVILARMILPHLLRHLLLHLLLHQ